MRQVLRRQDAKPSVWYRTTPSGNLTSASFLGHGVTPHLKSVDTPAEQKWADNFGLCALTLWRSLLAVARKRVWELGGHRFAGGDEFFSGPLKLFGRHFSFAMELAEV